MPESETYATGGYMYKVLDDGEYERLGYVADSGITLSVDGEEMDGFDAALLKQPTCVSFRLDVPWYELNKLYKLLTGRSKYTVARLRRDRKGHPKCK